MNSKICFEMSLFVVEAIRGRCASFMILTATVSVICGGQTNVSILVVYIQLFPIRMLLESECDCSRSSLHGYSMSVVVTS